MWSEQRGVSALLYQHAKGDINLDTLLRERADRGRYQTAGLWSARHPACNRRSLSLGHQSADTFRMWSFIAGITAAAGAIAFIVRSRRRAARHQPIEVGAVSEGWIAQHRGGRQG
jgi:hypothetical protein